MQEAFRIIYFLQKTNEKMERRKVVIAEKFLTIQIALRLHYIV